MKLTKIVGIGLGGLIVVLLVAAGLFVAFFPKELAAREAERRIEAATDRDLQLGKIDITLWPALGFSAENVSLSNPRDFDHPVSRGGVAPAQTPFITANRIVFAVAVLPLLHGEIQVKRLIFNGADVRLRAKQDGSANWTFPTEENSNQQTTLEDLHLEDVRLSNSNISFQGADGQPPLTLANVDASLEMASLDQPGSIHSEFDYRGQRLKVDAEIGKPRAVLEKGETPLTARVEGDLINAAFSGAFNAENGALAGQLQANGGSVRNLLQWIGSPMGAGGGFGTYRLQAAMRHVDQTTALTNAAIQLDAINARGALTIVTPPNNGKLHITGALSSPTVDLNPYLPASAQGAQAAGVEASSAWSTDRLDLTGLRAMDADLTLSIAALKFQKLAFSNVAMSMRIANGALDARLTRIGLYGGGGTARMIADGSTNTPRVAVELDARDVQAEGLLRDAIGFDKISGRGRVRASVIGMGLNQAALMQSLRGTASFTFNDGQFKGVNLAQVARVVQSLTNPQATAPATGNATDFSEMGASFTLANGVAATEDLHFLSPFIRLDGQGLINIGAQTLDMRLSPRAVNSAEGQGGNAALQGIGIPFRAHGSWAHVQFSPMLDAAAQNALRARAADILRHQDSNNPLTQLGTALFGNNAPAATPEQPAAQAQTSQQPAQTPAAQQQQTQQQQQSDDPLGDALRRAVERNTRHSNDQQTQPAQPAPAPGP